MEPFDSSFPDLVPLTLLLKVSIYLLKLCDGVDRTHSHKAYPVMIEITTLSKNNKVIFINGDILGNGLIRWIEKAGYTTISQIIVDPNFRTVV